MEAAEPSAPLDEFQKGLQGLYPREWAPPIIPTVVGQSVWASGSWTGAMGPLPAGVVIHP